MLEVSRQCPFVYNLAAAHCSTPARTRTSPVQTTCNHSTRNLTPESQSRAAEQPLSACLYWDIQFWLTARLGDVQPLALNQARIQAQRRLKNFTWYNLTGSFHPSHHEIEPTTQCRAELSPPGLWASSQGSVLFTLRKAGLDYPCTYQEVQVQHCTGFPATWLKWKLQLSHNTAVISRP